MNHDHSRPTPLFVRSQGSGPTVVAIHCSTASHAQWRALGEALSDQCQFLSVDMHGHGRSPAWPQDTPGHLQVDACAVAHAIRDARPPSMAAQGVHLVAHSYGAAVALQLALNQPRWVRSLTLYEPTLFGMLRRAAPAGPALAEIEEVAASVASLVRCNALLAAAQVFTTYWSGAQAWHHMGPTQRATMAARMATVPRHFEALFAATWDNATLQTLHMPVLVMQGGQTRASTRRVAALLQAGLPNVQSASFEDAGHMGPLSHGDAVVQQISQHLQQTGACQAPAAA